MIQKDLDSLQTKKQEKTSLYTYQVEYTEEEGRKGMVAANVEVL